MFTNNGVTAAAASRCPTTSHRKRQHWQTYMLLINQLSAGAIARRRLRVCTASAQKLTVLHT
jgi:hypothetical protein